MSGDEQTRAIAAFKVASLLAKMLRAPVTERRDRAPARIEREFCYE